jgi:hypothetical protein
VQPMTRKVDRLTSSPSNALIVMAATAAGVYLRISRQTRGIQAGAYAKDRVHKHLHAGSSAELDPTGRSQCGEPPYSAKTLSDCAPQMRGGVLLSAMRLARSCILCGPGSSSPFCCSHSPSLTAPPPPRQPPAILRLTHL